MNIKKIASQIYNGKIQHGLSSVTESYSGPMVPMAEYVLTTLIKESSPRMITSLDLSKKAGLIDVPVDVGKTTPSYDGMTAIYDDKIIQCGSKYSGQEFDITCRCASRELAREWMDEFNHAMMTRNQYRGKTLYAQSNDLVFKDIPKVAWKDVILDEKTKKDIRLNTVHFFNNAKLSGLVTKRSMVLYGPPGTGKTSAVKAVFGELNDGKVSRIYVTPETFKYSGVGNVFNMVEYLGPTVMAFEDIDFIGGSRDSIHVGSGLLGDLLTNMDGMRKFNNQIVIMATTNKMSMLDDALANRPGRFDRKIAINLPGPEHLKNIYLNLVSNVGDDIVKMSSGFTGSHVVEVVNTARILASHENKDVVDCLKEACQIVKDNFFAGQTIEEIKLATRKALIKKGYKIRIIKTAKIGNIADEILEKKILRINSRK